MHIVQEPRVYKAKHHLNALNIARNLLTLIVVMFLITGCDKNSTNSRTMVHKGEMVQLGGSEDRHTVALFTEGNFRCSAVLVSDNVALTAKHCLASSLEVRFTTPGDRGESPDRAQVVDFFTLDPDHHLIGLVRDLAAVRFNGSIPKSHEPAKVLRNISSLKASDALWSVGLGQVSHQCLGLESDDCVGTEKRVAMSFKKLLRLARERYYLIVNAPDGGLCSGDSGGPLFVARGGSLLVAAIHSGASKTLTPDSFGWDGWNCERGGMATIPIAPFLTEIEAWIGKPLPIAALDTLSLPAVTAPGKASTSPFAQYCDSDELPWNEGAVLDTALSNLRTFDCVEAERLLREGAEFRVGITTPPLKILEYMPWLEKLNLSKLNIGATPESSSQLRYLSFTKNLRSLDISFNREFPWDQGGLDLIRGLQKLERLDLFGAEGTAPWPATRFSDLLSPLGKLVTLNLPTPDNVESFPLGAIGHMRSLETLDAHHLELKVPSSSFQIPSLIRLDLEGSSLSDLSTLSVVFPNLKALDLGDSFSLTSLKPLSQFPVLESLRLAFFDDVSDGARKSLVLPSLPQLRRLIVDSSRVDITDLAATVPSLKELVILSPGLANLRAMLDSPAKTLPSGLESFNLFRGWYAEGEPELPSLNNLNFLSHLASLKRLSVQYSGLASVEGIEAFPLLEKVDIHGNQVEFVSELQAAKNLVELDLDSNPIRDLGTLATLKKVARARLDAAEGLERRCPWEPSSEFINRCSFIRHDGLHIDGDYRYKDWILTLP